VTSAAVARFAVGLLAGAAVGFFAANSLDRSRPAPPAASPAPSAPAPAAAARGDEQLTDEELRRAMAAVDARPNDYEANFKLGEYLLRIRSQPADAARYYLRASKLKPDAADALVGLGDASLATAIGSGREGAYDAKLLDAAATSYRKALEVDPKNEFARRGLTAVERARSR
jgi:tetratricopeptide (TPR) repeat protein